MTAVDPSGFLILACLAGLVGLLVLGGAFGWAFLRAAPGGHLHLDGSIAFAGLGLGWLGMFAAVLRIVRGRSPELLGFGGAAVCMGVVCLGVGFAVGES